MNPDVNFINVLRAAFTLADPESAKKTVKSSSFFPLSGSAGVKAARRTLVKLTPGLRRPVPERVPVVEKHCFGRSNFTSIQNAGGAKTEQINDCRLHFFLDDFDFAER